MRTIIFFLFWIAYSNAASVVPCAPKLEIKEMTLNYTTVKWACTQNQSYPLLGYFLRYAKVNRKNYEHPITLKLNRTHHEFTLQDLECGIMYEFFIFTDRDRGYIDKDFTRIQAVIGGPQLFPKMRHVIEVGSTHVIVNINRLKLNCDVKSIASNLKHLPSEELVKRTNINMSEKHLVFSGLLPKTKYRLRINVNGDFNDDMTYTFKTLCEEEVPVAPIRHKLLSIGYKQFVINIEEWECAESFAVQYRKSGMAPWNLATNGTKPEQESLLIQQLSPGTEYDVRITAYNRYGSTTVQHRFSQADENNHKVCGDWTLFADRCIKFIQEAGLQTKHDAQAVCNRFKDNIDIPSLLTIRDEFERQQLKFMRDVPGPLWLGLYSNDGKVYYWDDGTELDLTNWSNTEMVLTILSNQTTHVTHQCVLMLNDHSLGVRKRMPSGKPLLENWLSVSCSSWNYVVCEKPKRKPLGAVLKELLTLVGQLKSTVTQLQTNREQLEKRLTNAENIIKVFKKS